MPAINQALNTELPYQQTANGGILFRSTRRTWEVRIPSWVYDLWMPLVGAEAIAVYGLYCRFENQKIVKKLRQRDIAAACRIGGATLTQINETLQDCGFITVNKPTGTARLAHWTTEVIVHDPPMEIGADVIAKYAAPAGYSPLGHWLIEAPVGNAENGPSRLQLEFPGASTEVPNYVNSLVLNSQDTHVNFPIQENVQGAETEQKTDSPARAQNDGQYAILDGLATPVKASRAGKKPAGNESAGASHHDWMIAAQHLWNYDAQSYTTQFWKREVGALKRIRESGCTLDAFAALYHHFKNQPFWATQHLSINTLATHYPAWKSATMNLVQENGLRSSSEKTGQLDITKETVYEDDTDGSIW